MRGIGSDCSIVDFCLKSKYCERGAVLGTMTQTPIKKARAKRQGLVLIYETLKYIAVIIRVEQTQKYSPIHMTKATTFLLLTLGLLTACTNPGSKSNGHLSEKKIHPTNTVVLSSEIDWEQLNPARGDQSPQAGTIWGDRKGAVSTGFLAKFVDGFSSPPHIHNVTYRAVVIEGLVHNDDPEAANMWMKPGSFWTQPAGESHITSAKGTENIALVEINKGPYLVKPIDAAFETGERPINVDVSNVVWLNHEQTNWIDADNKATMSFLLESGGFRSLFVKLPQGFNGKIETYGTVAHAVVIQGEMNYTLPQTKEVKMLDPGSYFGSTDKAIHTIHNNSGNETLLYIRTNGEIFIR